MCHPLKNGTVCSHLSKDCRDKAARLIYKFHIEYNKRPIRILPEGKDKIYLEYTNPDTDKTLEVRVDEKLNADAEISKTDVIGTNDYDLKEEDLTDVMEEFNKTEVSIRGVK